MSENATGDISGGTPTPSTGVEGSSPAPESSSSQSTSETTQKLDVGMGPRQDGASSDVAAGSTDYGEDWWKQHGEAIFKHDRFKELNGFKKKYQDAEPALTFINDLGGFDEAQRFHQHFGPVWNHLLQQGENADALWSKLVPVFNNVLQGKDPFEGLMAPPQNPQNPADAEYGDEEDDDPRVAGLKKEIEDLKAQLGDHNKKFETQEQQKKREAAQRLKAHRQKSYNTYASMMEKRLGADKIPTDLTDYVGNILVKNLINYMPKDRRGRPINPLDQVSEQAFNDVWDKHVLPGVSKVRKSLLNSAKETINTGGPTLPDTTNGNTPAANQGRQRSSTHEKAKRFAAGIKNLQIG